MSEAFDQTIARLRTQGTDDALFSKTNPHLFSSFMISIFYTLPVTLGVVVAVSAAAWVETRLSRN